MTPDDYGAEVLPEVLAAWDAGCACASPHFRKLVGFDFHDYGNDPVMLADCELLVAGVILARFEQLGNGEGEPWSWRTRWRCPSCSRVVEVTSEEYSITMALCRARYEDDPPPAERTRYLVGFRHFADAKLPAMPDYTETTDVEGYLADLLSG